jgi:hypothetical protein
MCSCTVALRGICCAAGLMYFLRLVVIAAAIVRPAEAVEIVRIVRLDIECTANETNRLVELLAAIRQQIAEIVERIRIARLDGDELPNSALRVPLAGRRCCTDPPVTAASSRRSDSRAPPAPERDGACRRRSCSNACARSCGKRRSSGCCICAWPREV